MISGRLREAYPLPKPRRSENDDLKEQTVS